MKTYTIPLVLMLAACGSANRPGFVAGEPDAGPVASASGVKVLNHLAGAGGGSGDALMGEDAGTDTDLGTAGAGFGEDDAGSGGQTPDAGAETPDAGSPAVDAGPLDVDAGPQPLTTCEPSTSSWRMGIPFPSIAMRSSTTGSRQRSAS